MRPAPQPPQQNSNTINNNNNNNNNNDNNGLKLKSAQMQRPRTPQLPLEPPTQLATILPEPQLDKSRFQHLSYEELQTFENDEEKIKMFIAQQPVLSQMYETLIKIQFEVDELKQLTDNLLLSSTDEQYTTLKTMVVQKEAKLQVLQGKYSLVLKKYNVHTFISNLQKECDLLDDSSYDLESQFKLSRNPSEEDIEKYLQEFEQLRVYWHQKQTILQKLKKVYGSASLN
jgi:hypothetical protein